MHKFKHPELGEVDADSIRKSLGNFRKIAHQPSKLAARIAQAFTTTDSSVSITPDQWMECDDLGDEPYCKHQFMQSKVTRKY